MIFGNPAISVADPGPNANRRNLSAGQADSTAVTFESVVFFAANIVGIGATSTVSWEWKVYDAGGSVQLTYTVSVTLRAIEFNSIGNTDPTNEVVSFSSSWSGSASIIPAPEAHLFDGRNVEEYSFYQSFGERRFWSPAFHMPLTVGMYAIITNTTAPGENAVLRMGSSYPGPNIFTAYKPEIDFTATDDEGLVSFEAFDTQIYSDTYNYFAQYDWAFGDGDTDSQAISTTEHEYDDDGTYAVTLTVTDKYGASSSRTEDVSTTVIRTIGTLIDHTNTIYSAVKDGNDIQCYRFPDGTTAGRETLATIANARNPRLTRLSNGTMYVTAEDRADGLIYDWKSTDSLASAVKE